MAELHLDPDPGPRSVYFTVLRDMLGLLRDGPLGLMLLQRAGLETGVLHSPRGARRPFSRTTTWHHVSALQTLSLVRHHSARYHLTESGRELLAIADIGTPELGSAECAVFQSAALGASVVRRNFVALFTGDERGNFLTQGLAIRVFPRARKQYTVDTAAWGAIPLSEVQTSSIIWGMRLWFEQLALLGELLVPSRQGLPLDGHNILFPIWEGAAASEAGERFLSLLGQYIRSRPPTYGDTVVVSIPELLYELCPLARLSPLRAKQLVAKLMREQPTKIFAERASLPILQSGDIRGTQATRDKVAASFLRIGQTYYSHVHVYRAAYENG